MKIVKNELSETDNTMIETFKIRYPGWTIVRYIDGSMEYKQPIREELQKKKERTIWRSIA